MRRLPLGPLGASINALAVAATIGLAVWPDARSWFLRHAALGWFLVIALLVLTATLAQVLARKTSDHTVQLAELEARLPQGQDARLLREWLGGWTQGCEFMRWLDTGFIGFVMPDQYGVDVAVRVERWDADQRALVTPRLASAFEAVHRAAASFNEAITQNMWLTDGGTDRLEVPPEWKVTSPDRYAKAVHDLFVGAGGLRTSLAALFAEIHALGIIQPVS